MRQSPLRPLPLSCLALLLACGQAAAVETRQLGPDGAGACPEASATAGDEVDDDLGATTTTPRHPAQPKTTAPATAPRPAASGNRATNPPRWHSFLPGMFR